MLELGSERISTKIDTLDFSAGIFFEQLKQRRPCLSTCTYVQYCFYSLTYDYEKVTHI